MAYLKSEVRRLKRRVTNLETEKECCPATEKKQCLETASRNKESETLETQNKFNFTGKNVQQCITSVTYSLFTKEELVQCSISGKKSPKSDGQGRPALDQTKVVHLISAIQEHFPDTGRKTIIEKIQNIQKVLRRK